MTKRRMANDEKETMQKDPWAVAKPQYPHRMYSSGQRTSDSHAMKEPVMDVLPATHPGPWSMTELGQRL